jgi:hypothetical protein
MASPGWGSPNRGCFLFGKKTCKPNSVVCGHSSRRRVAADTHQRPTRRFRQKLKPPERIGPMRSLAWLLAKASLPIWSCSVWGLPCLRLYSRSGALLPHHFTLTPAPKPQAASGSPSKGGVAEAVSFLWHWPSMGFKAHVPDVIRHTALRSSDFPPPDCPRKQTIRQRPPGPPAKTYSTANRVRAFHSNSARLLPRSKCISICFTNLNRTPLQDHPLA